MFLSRYLYRGDYKNYEIKQSLYFRDLVIASYVKDMLLVLLLASVLSVWISTRKEETFEFQATFA